VAFEEEFIMPNEINSGRTDKESAFRYVVASLAINKLLEFGKTKLRVRLFINKSKVRFITSK